MSKLCFGCMRQKERSPVCEICGYDETRENLSHQLPIGTILQNQYMIGRVLGQGGFGITYMGWDQHLSIPVAIKEYYPGGVVQRHTRWGTNVVCANGEEPVLFHKHRERFLKEARTLAQLSDIPEIVQIKSFFSANDTAYIVMEYVDGITLKIHLKQLGRPMTESESLAVMEPVLRALQKVHVQHLVHRDISPDNIMLPKNGGVKLIDFGTVRYVDSSGVSKSTEAVLKPGFAPIEQYNTRGELGTWTDVYALCATFHYLLTGKVPTDVHERLVSGDQLTVLRNRQGISQKLIQTLEKGMKIIPSERIQTVEELYSMLYSQQKKGHTQKNKQAAKPENQQRKPEKKQEERKAEKKRNWILPVVGAAAALIVLGTGLLLLKPENREASLEATAAEETTAAATASPQELQYQDALQLMEAGEYGAAMDNFLELGDYRDSAFQADQCRLAIGYEEAKALADAGEHAKAGIAFAKLGDYQNAHDRSMEQWNLTRNRAIVLGGWRVVAIKEDGTVIADNQEPYEAWTNIIDLFPVLSNDRCIGLRQDGTIAVPYADENDSYWDIREKAQLEQMKNWTNVATVVNVGEMIGICYDGSVLITDTGEESGWQEISKWENVVTIDSLTIRRDDSEEYVPTEDALVALKADGTVLYTGSVFELDPMEWTDIEKLNVGHYGIVGFKTDGSIVVAEPPESLVRNGYFTDDGWNRTFYRAENWSDVVDISGLYRLKADGTVDAPEDAVGWYMQENGGGSSSRTYSLVRMVSNLTDIKSIYAYEYYTGLYCIKNDGTVVYVGDPWNGTSNVGEYTDIVEIFEGHIGLRSNGTLAIAQAHSSNAEKWTGLRVPEK